MSCTGSGYFIVVEMKIAGNTGTFHTPFFWQKTANIFVSDRDACLCQYHRWYFRSRPDSQDFLLEIVQFYLDISLS